MDKISYLEERVDDQINWYSDKSGYNQKMHKGLRGAEILGAILIPFIAGSGVSNASIIVGVLGVIVAICAGFAAQNKYQENWITYRTTSEQLKHHKYLFLTETAPYNNENAFPLFVSNVEGLISKENSQWHKSNQDNEPSSSINKG